MDCSRKRKRQGVPCRYGCQKYPSYYEGGSTYYSCSYNCYECDGEDDKIIYSRRLDEIKIDSIGFKQVENCIKVNERHKIYISIRGNKLKISDNLVFLDKTKAEKYIEDSPKEQLIKGN